MSDRLTREEFYRLRTDFLKLRSALVDRNTSLAAYPAHLPELRALFESVRSIGVLVAGVGELARVEAIYGWQVYDEMLRRIATALAAMRGAVLPSSSLIALDGVAGERFVLFLPRDAAGNEVTSRSLEELARAVGEQLTTECSDDGYRTLARAPRFEVGHALLHDDPYHRLERLVHRAVDEASRSHAGMQDRLLRRQEAELRRILLEGCIEVRYQPIHALHGGEVVGYEALSRGPEDGPLGDPRTMFEASQHLGMGTELDSLCQRRAVLGARLPPGARLFVNTLPSTLLAGPGGAGLPLEWIDGAGLQRSQVVIEITERGRVEDRERLRREIAMLHEAGVGIALDDIGTGLTGLQAIADLRPDFLKVDVSLVHNIDASPISQDLFRTLTRLGAEIGARVVGEGVETLPEAETLRFLGAEFGQGFLFSRPALALGSFA